MGFLEKIATRVADNLVNSKIIAADEKELYEYGINQGLVIIINLLSTVIIGSFFGMVCESIVFLMAYIPLRSFAGGYHATTPNRCYIMSLILIILALCGIKFITIKLVLYCFSIASAVIIFILAPVPDENKPLDEKEKNRYKKTTILIMVIEIAIVLVLLFTGINTLAHTIMFAFIVLACIVLVGKLWIKK